MSWRSKNEDRLSCLPDEILSYILSLMPTNFAVRTSILSKRFRYSWKLITNLDFTNQYPFYRSNCFSEIVDRVLKHCKTSQLKSFRLGLMRISKSDLSKWINEAIRLKVCELDMRASPTDLPLSLLTCKTLTKLRLFMGFFDHIDVHYVLPPVMLPALKTLDVSAHGYIPNVNLFKFIHGCPVLESLSLFLIFHGNEEGYSINIPTLKRLELKMRGSYFNKVVLDVPNLEYLFVRGCDWPHFVMENLSSLVEATVLFNSLREYNDRKAELLKGLSGVKSFSLFTSTPNDFVHSPFPKFPNLKHLYLKGSCILVIQILESSSELEHLCFEEETDFSLD